MKDPTDISIQKAINNTQSTGKIHELDWEQFAQFVNNTPTVEFRYQEGGFEWTGRDVKLRINGSVLMIHGTENLSGKEFTIGAQIQDADCPKTMLMQEPYYEFATVNISYIGASWHFSGIGI